MTPIGHKTVLDRAEGLRRVGGNDVLYRRLVDVFLEDVPRLIRLLRSAIAVQSARELRLAAHSLKGSASAIGAAAVAERAELLERIGNQGDLRDAEKHEASLLDELRQLTLVLNSDASVE